VPERLHRPKTAPFDRIRTPEKEYHAWIHAVPVCASGRESAGILKKYCVFSVIFGLREIGMSFALDMFD
jgi:hypothetical protein